MSARPATTKEIVVKILVIDDHALVREGLHQVLKGLDENVVVLQAGTCGQAFDITQQHLDLDLVLLDYHLPDMTGLEALDIFGRRHPELPIVMLSGSANTQIMRQVLQSGASGFVTKSTLSDELLHAVRLVLDGEVYTPRELEGRSDVSGFDQLPDKTPLTQRQELVLRELLDGRSNKEIALTLNVSEETVKTHVAAILRHFDVQNRTQAVVAAARSGYRPATA
ncbi:response regulator transcription factor [Rhodoferax bucti]|uniref:response regulator transcription factor n=1 Tax=Rhodoferax bucti TaxID=2576305 RepID=UPI0011083EAE|nr:response regulator transcription factor [Rhodoferax bucti]